jgi:hypothetical protein
VGVVERGGGESKKSESALSTADVSSVPGASAEADEPFRLLWNTIPIFLSLFPVADANDLFTLKRRAAVDCLRVSNLMAIIFYARMMDCYSLATDSPPYRLTGACSLRPLNLNL